VFQSSSQHDQNLALSGQVSWTIPRTDLSIGYSSVYQLTGDNVSHNIEVGLGAEQVVFADYDAQPAPRLAVTSEIATVVYPAAHDVPLFVEASVEARYTAWLELSTYAGIFEAVRSGPLGENHFYVKPAVDKTFDLTQKLDLSAEASAGIKIFQAPGSIPDNMFDLLASVGLDYALTSSVSVGAKFALAWTNLERGENPQTHQVVTPTLGDEYVPIATLSVSGDW
jgi:hypothetical protein